MIIKAFVAAAALMGTTVGALAQDPAAVLNDLIRNGIAEQNLRHQNQMMRLEAERQELLRQREAPDFAQYGAAVDPKAPDYSQSPPQGLRPLPPARRQRSAPRPGIVCDTLSDGEGGGTTFCD